MRVADKTLYWWSVHLERFLNFCRSAGAESSEIPEAAARLFLESLPRGGPAQEFAKEQARMALDVFMAEMVGWSWGEDRYGRMGPKFRLKANSAGLTTTERRGRREVEQPKVGPEGARRAGASESKHTEKGLADHRVNELDSPRKSDGSRLRLGEPTDRRASHSYPGDSLSAAAPRGVRGHLSWENGRGGSPSGPKIQAAEPTFPGR